MGQQVKTYSKLNFKSRRREIEFERMFKLFVLDPKPSDLTMSRLKFFERKMEGRTRICGKRLG